MENLLKQHDSHYPDVDIPSLFPKDEASKMTMQLRTQAIAEKSALRLVSGELHAKNKYISFNLYDDYYCISLDYVKEVLKDTSITRVPGTPDFIEGIMNLRGDYITVINLKKFLEISNDNLDEETVQLANDFHIDFSGKTDPEGIYIGRDKFGTNILVDFDRRAEDKTKG